RRDRARRRRAVDARARHVPRRGVDGRRPLPRRRSAPLRGEGGGCERGQRPFGGAMTTDLDRLELELRCLPGVVAVGLDKDANGEGLLIQAVVLSPVAPTDLRSRIRRIVDANVREGASLEILVDSMETAGAT